MSLKAIINKYFCRDTIKNEVASMSTEAKREYKKYIDRGVYGNKIIITEIPSVCIWSLSRKCIVNENGIDALEVIKGTLISENNKNVYLSVWTDLPDEIVKQINESEGIIVSTVLYDNPERFRFGFIPTN